MDVPERTDWHPLVIASAEGDVAQVEKLLNEGASPDTALQYGTTALMVAARRGHIDVVKLLLDKGANPNAIESHETEISDNETALFKAARSGYVNIVKLLLNNGARVDYGSTWGSPLCIAVQKRNLEMIETLLANGANINVRTRYYRLDTPLMIAYRERDLATMEVLLAKGARLSGSDISSLETRNSKKQLAMNQLLEQYGSKAPSTPKGASGGAPNWCYQCGKHSELTLCDGHWYCASCLKTKGVS